MALGEEAQVELMLSGIGSRSSQVYAALRERIESGALPAGTRLPGTRTLASDLGISRGTVTGAYEQLVAEGYCCGRARSGTWVTDIFAGARDLPVAGRHDPLQPRHPIRWRAEEPDLIWDLRFGLPNPADFPHQDWARLLRRELKTGAQEQFLYPFPEGLPRLRRAVAAHLARRRGLPCTADQVLITHGAQQAFSLIARALLPAGVPVAVEDPGYRGFGQAVRAAGLGLVPVPVDDEGLVVSALPARTVSAVYVTPAHQFPSGVLMSAARRRALVAWAVSEQAWIIEDDYDSAYRFDAPPLPPLKQLDRDGRVLLVGSFSKTLFPGLRLGYVVADPHQLSHLALMKNLDDAGSPGLYQATLAAFMEQGRYDRHLRRSQRLHAARRRALIQALEREFGDTARLVGAESGLHLVVDVGLSPSQEREVVRLSRLRGLGLYAQASFAEDGGAAGGLVLGYACLEPPALSQAVAVLAGVVAEVRRQPVRNPV